MSPWGIVGWVAAIAVVILIVLVIVLLMAAVVVGVVRSLSKPKYAGKHVIGGRRDDVD